jgi:hypothetical protein
MVDAQQLVGIGQIAAGLQISHRKADLLSRQAGFPTTSSESVRGRKWFLEDVKQWAAENDLSWQVQD